MGQLGLLVLIGAAGGAMSGLAGIGGGIILVPALVYFMGFSQAMAQGTSLALMLPPIGILAAYSYYQRGFVDLRVAAVLCVGFLIGSWFGARWAVSIPQEALKRVFGLFLFAVSIKMLCGK